MHHSLLCFLQCSTLLNFLNIRVMFFPLYVNLRRYSHVRPTVFLASCSRTTNLLIQDSSFVERLSRIYSYISELILLNISIIISLLLTECLFLYNFLRFHMLFAILIHGIWSVTLIKITPIKETNDIYRHQDCCHKSIPYQPY